MVVPSPATLLSFWAADLINLAPICSPRFSSVEPRSTASATVTPS